MNYASLEGLGKKDAFKKNFVNLVGKTGKNLLVYRFATASEESKMKNICKRFHT